MSPLSMLNGSSANVKYNHLWPAMKWVACLTPLLFVGLFCAFIPWYVLLPFALLITLMIVLSIRFEWGIYLLVFMIVIEPHSLGFVINSGWSIGYLEVFYLYIPVIIFSIFGLVLAKWAKIKTFSVKNPLRFPMGILLLYAGLTFLWTPGMEHSMYQFFLLVLNFVLFYLAFYAIADESFHKKVIWCWIISGCLYGLLAISLYFVPPPGLRSEYATWKNFVFSLWIAAGGKSSVGQIRRASALSGGKLLTLYINPIFALAVGLFLIETKKLKKWLLFAITILIISVNLLAMTRAGTGALLIMGFFLFFTLKRYRKHFFIHSAVFILGTVFILLFENIALSSMFMTKSSTPRLVARFMNSDELQDQAPGRLDMWQNGFEKLEKTSYMGLGPGSFKYYVKRVPHAHSIYFSTLFDFGIVGFGALLVIIIIIWKGFLPRFKLQDSYLQIMTIAVFGGLLGMWVHGLVDFEYNTPLVWFYLGLAMATLSLAKREDSEINKLTSSQKELSGI